MWHMPVCIEDLKSVLSAMQIYIVQTNDVNNKFKTTGITTANGIFAGS